MRLGTLRGVIDLGLPLTGSKYRTRLSRVAELHFIFTVQYSDSNIHIQ
jgi:hypothetical protein